MAQFQSTLLFKILFCALYEKKLVTQKYKSVKCNTNMSLSLFIFSSLSSIIEIITAARWPTTYFFESINTVNTPLSFPFICKGRHSLERKEYFSYYVWPTAEM